MSTGFFNVPKAINEPIKQYAPNSPERSELQQKLSALRAEVRDIPMYIGGKEVRTGAELMRGLAITQHKQPAAAVLILKAIK